MSKQNKTVLIIAIAIIAVVGLIMINGKKLPSNDQNNNGNKYEAGKLSPIDSTDHIFGKLGAPIQMIIYSDFECPFCADFSETIKQIERDFADKVTIAFRHYTLPGHAEAKKAAEASECAAEQGKFWEMHDKLFADNKAGRLSEDQHRIDAADLGLDTARFNQCLDSGKFAAKVAEVMAGGKNAGVSGTPTSFINGNIYPGAYPFEDFTTPDGQQESGMKNIINNLLK
ncbi:MAG: thioredoxin domain-containing protein [bacterium]|nr:thioredoxin domain-containing protein [bacterium]